MHKTDTRKLTQLALLIAIQLILSFTPLGFIILPGMVSITIMHIPVIVGGIVMGPMYGGILGLVFGLLSMYKATTAATSVVDQAFSPFLSGAPVQSIIMCIIPRVLLGVVAALLFRALEKRIKSKGLAIAISAKGGELRKSDQEYQIKEELLQAQLDQEKERAEDLEEYKVYVKTKQYAEEVAKERLGLVNPDEILLKPEDEN